MASTIRELSIDKAGKYIKKNFESFGKTERHIIGHKINPNSENNYYTVRDLSIQFDNLNEGLLANLKPNPFENLMSIH